MRAKPPKQPATVIRAELTKDLSNVFFQRPYALLIFCKWFQVLCLSGIVAQNPDL
jgi:hypothetical protein